MTVVLLFGRLQEIAGWRERQIDPPPATLLAMRRRLAADDPRLGEALEGAGVQAAVDQVLVRGDMTLTVNSEVAFLPPMSGG